MIHATLASTATAITQAQGTQTLIAILLGISFVTYGIVQTRRKAATPSLPMAPVSALSAASLLVDGVQAVDFLYRMAKEVVSPVYRLPLPQLRPVYVVTDAGVGHAILADNAHDKSPFYEPLCKLTCGPSIVTRKTADPAWRRARKHVVHAFRPDRIIAMRSEIMRILEDWITSDVESLARAGGVLDINQAMLDVTVQFICSAGLGYACPMDEARKVVADLNVAAVEYALLQPFNPLRAYMAWALPAVREARMAMERVEAFAKRILAAHRATPPAHRADGTIIDLLDSTPDYPDEAKVSDIIVFLIGGSQWRPAARAVRGGLGLGRAPFNRGLVSVVLVAWEVA
mmetsp:Transcript_16057/g.41538  ORF Transcript_16057/g.41538 Transcript_16057/m.41538 type:complete len:344 (-) Transcript_16057:985-2016(-)